MSREVANCAVWAERIGRVDARLLAPARELADLLGSRAATLPVVVDSLIHKDLHLGHVIVGDGGLATVIDLDEARMGDPALDVAHLCAYAEEAEVRVGRAGRVGPSGPSSTRTATCRDPKPGAASPSSGPTPSSRSPGRSWPGT